MKRRTFHGLGVAVALGCLPCAETWPTIRAWRPEAAEARAPCPPMFARNGFRRTPGAEDSYQALRRGADVAELSWSDSELTQEQLAQTAIPLLRQRFGSVVEAHVDAPARITDVSTRWQAQIE